MLKPIATLLLPTAVLLSTSCSYQFRERDVFLGRKTVLLTDAIERRSIELQPPDGPTLRGWYLTPKAPRRHLVYLYGANMSVVQEYGKLHWLAQTYDMDILVMDYPGYGFSEGTPTVDGLARASVRFFDWMAVRWPEAETPIFVYGHSMGTGFALYVGINRARSAVILEAPFASVPDLVAAKKRHLSWYQRPFVSIQIDPALTRWAQPIDMIPGLAAPLLIIHGTEDHAVPLEHGKRLFEAASTPNKHFCALQGRGHFAVQPSRDEPTDLNCLESFLAQLGSGKQAVVSR